MDKAGGAEKSGSGDQQIRLTFGEMEARLALLHEIGSEKRTQFQARLRNFQNKHGIPQGVTAGRGKTIYYRPGQVVELALALEFTQLGLLPERVAEIYRHEKFPIFMAVRMAAQAILSKGGFLPDKLREDENSPQAMGKWWETHDEADDPLSMFLYFDPFALEALTDISTKYEDPATATFFYGGAGIIRENIVRWTAGPHVRRLALINVTALIWSLIVRTKPENQTRFLNEVVEWADWMEDQYFLETVQDAVHESETGEVPVVVIESYEDVVKHAELLKDLKGLPRPVADAMIKRAQQMIETGKMPGDDAGLSGKPMGEMSEAEMEEEIIGQLTLGGMPEMVARGAMDSTREWRRERKAEREAKEAAGYYVDRAQIEAAGLYPLEVGRSGKVLAEMTPEEFALELELRRKSEQVESAEQRDLAPAQPGKKSKPRKAKKHGDR